MSQYSRDRTSPGRRPSAPRPAEHEPNRLLPNPPEGDPAALALSEWPFQSYLELGALPSAVPCARLHARQVLWEWGLQGHTDPAELVVSELVTNGVRASRGVLGSRFGGRWSAGTPPVRLWLQSDHRTVLVQVWDGNNRMPTRQELDPESEGGRGLWLLEAISEDWGAFRPEHASGKVAWAALAKP